MIWRSDLVTYLDVKNCLCHGFAYFYFQIIDNLMHSLSQAEASLILPTVKHPAEIINSEYKVIRYLHKIFGTVYMMINFRLWKFFQNIFDPPLPEDVLVDFYIRRDQLIMKLFFFNLKSPSQAPQPQFVCLFYVIYTKLNLFANVNNYI